MAWLPREVQGSSTEADTSAGYKGIVIGKMGVSSLVQALFKLRCTAFASGGGDAIDSDSTFDSLVACMGAIG
jgi:hypothetical protein